MSHNHPNIKNHNNNFSIHWNSIYGQVGGLFFAIQYSQKTLLLTIGHECSSPSKQMDPNWIVSPLSQFTSIYWFIKIVQFHLFLWSYFRNDANSMNTWHFVMLKPNACDSFPVGLSKRCIWHGCYKKYAFKRLIDDIMTMIAHFPPFFAVLSRYRPFHALYLKKSMINSSNFPSLMKKNWLYPYTAKTAWIYSHSHRFIGWYLFWRNLISINIAYRLADA